MRTEERDRSAQVAQQQEQERKELAAKKTKREQELADYRRDPLAKMRRLHARTVEQLREDIPKIGASLKVRPRPPPWLGRFPPRDYDGRKAWWEELKAPANVLVARGTYIVHRPMINEFNPNWVDPPLEAGDSTMGRGGKTATVAYAYSKWDEPTTMEEYQERVYNENPTVKRIKEEFNLSPEHPGLRYHYNVHAPFYTDKNKMGYNMEEFARAINQTVGLHRIFPRFWDSELHEDCHKKALAMSRYGLGFAMLQSVFKHPVQEHFRFTTTTLINVARLAPYPTAVGAIWGGSACLSCKLRGDVDDFWNPHVAGAISSAFVASIRGLRPATQFFIASMWFATGFSTLRYMGDKWGTNRNIRTNDFDSDLWHFENPLAKIDARAGHKYEKWW